MGFWSDVRALRRAIHDRVAAGHGSQSLILAMQEQAQAQPAPKRAPAPTNSRKVSPLPHGAPVGQRISAQEYRELMGLP